MTDDTIFPVLNVIFPSPDLIALSGGVLLTRLERQAQGMAVDLPRALPALREHDGVQRPVRTEMLRPVRVVRDDFPDDLRTDLACREAMERVGRPGVHDRQYEAQCDTE